MKIKIFLSKTGIFLLFLIIGFSFRFFWYFFPQKEIMEYQFIEKPFREAKGGGKTPEETWAKYLDALEKENFDETLKYSITEDINESRKTFQLLKEKNLLKKQAECERKLYFDKDVDLGEIGHSEWKNFGIVMKRYKAKCRTYKEIDFLFTEEQFKPLLEKIWEGGEEFKDEFHYIDFIYNPYTKTWFIK